MQAVLTEYGWIAPADRRCVRELWRAMHAEERRIREEKRKAADEANGEGQAAGKSSRSVRKRREADDFDEE